MPMVMLMRAAANFVALVLPEGAQVHPVPGDGACFFHAVSKALEVLHDRKVSAAHARARKPSRICEDIKMLT